MGSQDPESCEEVTADRIGGSPPRRLKKSIRRLPAWATVSIAVLCVAVLLATSLVPDPSAFGAKAGTPSGMTTALSGPAPPPEFPYLVAPNLYPTPSNISPGGTPSLVHLVATPTGTDYLLFANDSGRQLWLAPGAYDPIDARALFSHQACLSGSGSTCVPTRSVYLTWGQAARVYSTAGTIQADAITSVGSTLAFGVTVGGSTTIYQTSNGGDTVTTLGGSLSGTLTSLSATAESVLATTMSSGTLSAATLSMSGGIVHDVAVGPSGQIQNASGAWVATPTGASDEAVVASDATSGEVLAYSSTNGGQSFSGGVSIGVLNETAPSATFDQIGQTRLVPSGGIVGQVALTAVGGGLFVLFTNRTYGGRVIAETEVSPDGGVHWSGPYLVATSSGSIQDPAVTADPDGDAVATWRDNGNGNWQVDQAVFSANGLPRVAPAALPASGGNAAAAFSAGPPSVAVDWLGRPLYAWSASGAQGPQVDYSGAFLSAANSLNVLENLVNDPLEPADFSPGTTTTQTTFVSTTDSLLTSTSANISSDSLSAAQNDTTKEVIPAVTHLQLTVTGGLTQPLPSTSTLADTLGTFSPNVYLAVFAAQLVNALGGGVTASPLQSASAFGVFSGPQPPPVFQGSTTSDSETAYVTVTAIPQSPDGVQLSAAGSFPTYTKDVAGVCQLYPGGPLEHNAYIYTSQPYRWWSNVTLTGAGTGHFSSSSALPSVYLTNLSSLENFTWSGAYSADYSESVKWYGCGGGSQPMSPDSLGPLSVSVSVSGYSVTALGIIPGQPHFLNGIWTSTTAPPKLTAEWNNSMLAQDSIWVNYTGGGNARYWPNSTSTSQGYVISLDPSPTFYGLSNSSYTAQVVAQSQQGVYIPSERPAVSFGDSNPYPALQAGYSCTFNLAPPNYNVWWTSGENVSNVSTSSAQVKWSASADGLGSVSYYDFGTGVNYTISNVPAIQNKSSNSTTWDYTVVLHNLDTFGLYTVSVGVGVGSGCLEKKLVKSFTFETPHVLTLWENDQPYDSITQTGGGATVFWDIPSQFLRSAKFSEGTLFWSNSTATVEMSLNQSINQAGQNWNRTLTWESAALTLPQMNTSYTAWVDLDFTEGGTTIAVTSVPATFVYLKDTSGDGLTDLEKGLGWNVPYDSASTWISYWDTANPLLYSTNGLVNDYLEKKYGLNPNVVDSAGSHMLDLWNLTFDLGKSSTAASIPESSSFHFWWENNTTFYPFDYAQYPGGPVLKKPLVSGDLSNISCTARSCPADLPYSAEVLWSSSALSTFLAMPGVQNTLHSGDWLRGLVTTYGGERYLTLWGKLSWGANPLVASTPGGGLPDGARVNPLYQEVVQINFGLLGHGLTGLAGINYGTCGGVPTGSAYALRFWVNGTERSPVSEVGGWFSQQVNITHNNLSCGYIDFGNPVQWTFPVDNSVQFQRVSLQMVLNVSGSPPNLVPLQVSGSSVWANFTIDLLNPPPLTYYNSTAKLWEPWFQFYGSTGYDGTATFMVFGMTALEAGAKAPTYLWLPDDNSTVSSLPAGLQRYTGAQNFALLVVNASGSLKAQNVPTPWGSSYSVSLASGLNNFLIPMMTLVNSPLGQALYLGKVVPDSSGATPPLLQSTDAGKLVAGSGSATLSDLACYWQNRAVGPNSSTTPLCSASHPSDKGVTVVSGLQLTLLNATPGACTIDCGTVPTNPNLESGSEALPALGVVIALNSTNTSMLYALLAGVLDNATGGVNGTFSSLQPYQLATLNLPTVVMDALANDSTSNTPIFGPPTSQQILQHQNSCSGWGCLTQAWNSFAGDVMSGLTTIATFAWSVTIAPAIYLGELVVAGARLLYEYAIEPAATILSQIGSKILNALNAVIQWVINHVIDPALNAIIGPIEAGVGSFDKSLNGPLTRAWASENSSGSVGQANAVSFANAFVSGAPFEIALGISVAVTVALSLLTPFDLGPSFVVGLVVGLIAGAALSSIASLKSAAQLSSSAVSAIEGVVNPVKSFPTTEWGTLAGVFGLLTAGEEVPWSWYVLSQAVLADPPASIYMSATWVMALALTALVIGVIAVSSASAVLLLLAFVMACAALAGVTYHFLTQVAALEIPSLTQLGWVDVGLSVSAMLGSAVDLGVNWNQLQKAL